MRKESGRLTPSQCQIGIKETLLQGVTKANWSSNFKPKKKDVRGQGCSRRRTSASQTNEKLALTKDEIE